MKKIFDILASTGAVLGKGLIAGAAGTLAMSLSQLIEMKLTKRGGSSTPVVVAGKTLGVEPKGKGKLEQEKENTQSDGNTIPELEKQVEENTNRFSQWMHYAYGTSQGAPRGILELAGLNGWKASISHFVLVWGTEQIMLPATQASKPITQWTPVMIASDLIHHAVYASVAGYLYDQMQRKKV